jgi:hypothetical protein
MKVKNALALLNDLPLESEIACQWYEQGDMGTFNGENLTTEEWKLANAIFDKYELSDMRYAIEDAIYEAKRRLAKEKQ